MPQEDDLRVLEVVVGVRQHLVEAVEEQLDRVAEAVVRLADRGSDEEEAGADDKLDDVLDRLEALLDGVLVLLRGDVVGEVAQAGQEAPGNEKWDGISFTFSKINGMNSVLN